MTCVLSCFFNLQGMVYQSWPDNTQSSDLYLKSKYVDPKNETNIFCFSYKNISSLRPFFPLC